MLGGQIPRCCAFVFKLFLFTTLVFVAIVTLVITLENRI